MIETWRLLASYENEVRFPSGSTVATSLLAASNTLVTALPRGLILARHGSPHHIPSCSCFRGDRWMPLPACRIKYRRGDKTQRVRGAYRPAGRVESKTRSIPKRVDSRHDATRTIIDCRVYIPKCIDLATAGSRLVDRRRMCSRADRRSQRPDSRDHILLWIGYSEDRLTRPDGLPSRRPWCSCSRAASIDATGLFAASKTVVDTKPSALVVLTGLLAAS